MCGINGIFAYGRSASAPDRNELLATRDHMIARGPDGAGEYWSDDRRIGLGHRRLSIQDLSTRADQPMRSACGRYTVVFNGEIYNYPALRKTLEAQGRQFLTTSDTEVLLHLFELHGHTMVSKLRGMFAFGIWDNQQHSLFLARDPYGIKPLYISDDGWQFRFASQVKALLAGGRIGSAREPAGIVGFYLWGCVPEPFTMYRGIGCLPAGHTLLIDQAGPRDPKPYASVAEVFAQADPASTWNDEIEAGIQTAARESVAAHLLSDVEVGVFLSAGIDSGAMLGMMRNAGQDRIKAITLGFESFVGTNEDEAPLAVQVAERFGADHHVRIVSKAEFEADLPLILAAMDQPSVDGINTWFVSKAASEHGLKVALSGLGGDELLAGYPGFKDIPRWVGYGRLPRLVPGFGAVARSLMRTLGVFEESPKMQGFFEHAGTYQGAYFLRRAVRLPSSLPDILGADIAREGLEKLKLEDRIARSLRPGMRSPVARICSMESENYLRNQLLRDSDWAGMAHSLEIRTPLVDFELLTRLAPSVNAFRNLRAKAALGLAPDPALPGTVINRAKTGFSVPFSDWLMPASGTSSYSSADRGGTTRGWSMVVGKEFTAQNVETPAMPTTPPPRSSACLTD